MTVNCVLYSHEVALLVTVVESDSRPEAEALYSPGRGS